MDLLAIAQAVESGEVDLVAHIAALRKSDPGAFRGISEAAASIPPAFLDPKFPHQSDFIAHPSRRKVLLATRRAGKSVAAGRYMFKVAHENPRCSIIYVGLTRESAKRIMVKDIIKPLQAQLGIRVEENKTELSFTFENGSVIYLLGMDQSEEERRKLFGQKYKLAVVDESALYRIDLRQLVYSAIEPALMDLQGTVVLMGMPSNRPVGLFYELTKNARPCNPGQWDAIDEKGGVAWHGFAWSWAQNHSRPEPGGPTIAESIAAEVASKKRINPKIEETPIFRQEYLGLWVLTGAYVFGPAHTYTKLPNGYRAACGIDLAYSTKSAADWSVAVILLELDGIYYVRDVIRRQVTAPEFGAELKEIQTKRYPRIPMRLHWAGPELGTVQFLRKEGLTLSVHPPLGDKLDSAQLVSAAWNEGRVQVPESAPWLSEFLDEVQGFTGTSDDDHDDQVDALGNAHRHLPAKVLNPPVKVTPAFGTPEWTAWDREQRMKRSQVAQWKKR